MTSTNIFKGFAGDKRSSKVLKPPGGGNTDIFGAPEPPIKKDSGRNASSILEGTNTEKPAELRPTNPKVDVNKPSLPEPTTQESNGPSRSRVPPGGFSSGPLW